MAYTISLSEIVTQTLTLKSKQEQVDWLKKNDSWALQVALAIIYDPVRYQWDLPQSVPPYTPSNINESHGMLYREIRKMKYFIKGNAGENLPRLRKEALFIQMLESVDKGDAKLLEAMLLQKPLKGLAAETINEALGPIITIKERKARNGKEPKEV